MEQTIHLTLAENEGLFASLLGQVDIFQKYEILRPISHGFF